MRQIALKLYGEHCLFVRKDERVWFLEKQWNLNQIFNSFAVQCIIVMMILLINGFVNRGFVLD